MYRRTIAVDFDGVIHSYVTPWLDHHIIPDMPVEGSIVWLSKMIQKFDVYIFSTRAKTWRGRRAIKAYIKKHSQGRWEDTKSSRGLKHIKVSYKKLPAIVYIDDRAYRFNGNNWPTRGDIYRLTSWQKR